jgi:hypothetical protein
VARSIGIRTCSIGAVAGVIGMLVFAASASAAVTGQTISVTASPSKQPKSQFGPLSSLAISLDTAYTPPFEPNATQTVISFSRDLSFSPGGLSQCDLSAISTVPQAQADAVCGSSKVGTGSATINGGLLTGVVAAYNGSPSGGSPRIGLHVDVFTSTGSYAFSTTLTGLLNTQANTLTVSIPPTGTSITHFGTTINQVRTGTRGGLPLYYAMARCSSGKWVSGETTTFNDGQQISATSAQSCQVGPAKKAKKQKKRKKNGKKGKKGAEGRPPKNGAYNGKTDQEAVATSFRHLSFTVRKGRVTLTSEPVVAWGLCLSAPRFVVDGNQPSKKFGHKRAFSITHTFLGSKIDKIHGRFVSSTEIEGYAIYHFNAQDLCPAGKMKVDFKAKHK